MTIQQVLALARPALLSLKPYSSARDEFDQSTAARDLIFLDANESPYPTTYNRYPDPHQRELKKVIASLKQISERQIFIGNGSDEAIDLLIRAFCQPSVHNVIIPSPTYGMYSVSAAINEVSVKSVSLTSAFDLDPDAVLYEINNNTRIIFLCSPNNPSGNLLSSEAIDKIIESFSGLVIVDEAYIDFSGSVSLLEAIDRKPNLVVLQTLSKAWGLAGLRLGMAFGHPDIIALLDRIKPPYNISSVAQRLAIEALDDRSSKQRRVNEILEQRRLMAKALQPLKSVKHVFPSQANFLLVRIKDAPRAYEFLVNDGIVVRDRSRVALCEGCLRITIGTAEENNKLLKVLAAYE